MNFRWIFLKVQLNFKSLRMLVENNHRNLERFSFTWLDTLKNGVKSCYETTWNVIFIKWLEWAIKINEKFVKIKIFFLFSGHVGVTTFFLSKEVYRNTSYALNIQTSWRLGSGLIVLTHCANWTTSKIIYFKCTFFNMNLRLVVWRFLVYKVCNDLNQRMVDKTRDYKACTCPNLLHYKNKVKKWNSETSS